MGEALPARPSPPRRPPSAPPARPAPVPDEHELYPVHEEDSVPGKPRHEAQARYLRGALAAYLRGKWVTGDICMYWEERNFHQYAAPDVLVVDAPAPDPLPSVHLRWSDPRALLVVEVGSKSTFLRDEGPRLETDGLDLRVPEYLYYHPHRHDLRFFRIETAGYQAVFPDARGWVYSETLDVWFGEDEAGWLRVYTPAGERLLTHEEEAQARRESDERAADLERRLAEAQEELRRLQAGRG